MQINEFKQSVGNVVDLLIAQANMKLQDLIATNVKGIFFQRFTSPPPYDASIEAIFNTNTPQKTISIASFNCTLQDTLTIEETVDSNKKRKIPNPNPYPHPFFKTVDFFEQGIPSSLTLDGSFSKRLNEIPTRPSGRTREEYLKKLEKEFNKAQDEFYEARARAQEAQEALLNALGVSCIKRQ